MMDGIEITAIVLDLLLIRCRILCECFHRFHGALVCEIGH